MQSAAPSPLRTILLALLALALVPVASASAAGTYSAVSDTTCAGYDSGGADADHTLYMPCGSTKVRIVTASGSSRLVSINAPVAHIAPSPHGEYLYAINETTASRFNRTATGSYVRDTSFRFELPNGWAEHSYRICGWGIASDAYGNVYISNGGWCEGNPQLIIKYDANGSIITQFGDYGDATPGGVGSMPGAFRPNMGLAVTPDGSRIWVADENNQRVQFFQRQRDLTYAFAGMWSGEGTAWYGQVGAIYNVALDAWGSAYVTQTSTHQVWRLDPDGGHALLVAVGPGVDHTLSVDALGRVYVGEWQRRYDRPAADPVPGSFPVLPPEPQPDVADPVVSDLTAPSETTDASVTLRISASDDIAVADMRLADESGDWGAWRDFQSRIVVDLSAGIGTKAIYVQVRDTWGKESNVRLVTIARKPVPDVTAPTLTVTAPASSTARVVTLAISSSDAIGVTHLRIAGDDGNFGPWESWSGGATSRSADLGSYGTRTFSVQVRDASYNVSDTANVTIVFAPPPVVVVPTLPVVDPTSGQAADVAPPVVVGGGGVVRRTVDHRAPVIRALVVPTRSCSRIIILRLAARDASGVRLVRIANEDGRYGRWRAFSPRVRQVLSRRLGRKLVTVQVRDAAGTVSRAASRRVLVRRCRR
jgi:hypothetical protein